MCLRMDADNTRHFRASAIDSAGLPGAVAGSIGGLGDGIAIGNLDGSSPQALPRALGIRRVWVLADELDIAFSRLLISSLRASHFCQRVNRLPCHPGLRILRENTTVPDRRGIRPRGVQEKCGGKFVTSDRSVGSHRSLLVRRSRNL